MAREIRESTRKEGLGRMTGFHPPGAVAVLIGELDHHINPVVLIPRNLDPFLIRARDSRADIQHGQLSFSAGAQLREVIGLKFLHLPAPRVAGARFFARQHPIHRRAGTLPSIAPQPRLSFGPKARCKPAQGKRVRRVRAVRPFYAGTSAALGSQTKNVQSPNGA